MEAGPPPLRFEFEWSEPEYRRLLVATDEHKAPKKDSKEKGPWGCILGTGAALALVLSWAWVSRVSYETFFLAIISIGVGLKLLQRVLEWGVPRMAAGSFRNNNPCAPHPMRRELDDVGLHTGCEVVTTLLRWEGIAQVVETPEFFLFYYMPRSADYLPKRAVGSDAMLERTRSFLRTRLGAKARLLDAAAAEAAPAA